MSDKVKIENIICGNDHGKSGQIMEKNENGKYQCPECSCEAVVAVWASGCE